MLYQQQSLTYFTYTKKLITNTSKTCILINKLDFFYSKNQFYSVQNRAKLHGYYCTVIPKVIP